VNQKTLEIVSTAYGKGRRHDMRVFKRSKTRTKPETELLGDSGYQGIKKLHAKSRTPHKGWWKKKLTKEQKVENRALSSVRIVVEHVIRRLKRPKPVRCWCGAKKVFRVLKEVYRHRRRFGLRVSLIAGLYNADLKVKP
jgi:DDE superfamily endonuclease